MNKILIIKQKFLVGTYKIKGFDLCYQVVENSLQNGYRMFGKLFLKKTKKHILLRVKLI